MNPFVSVLMSVKDGLPYLSQAIESILNQSFQDFEFVIIDDGSSALTKEILENYRYSDSRIKIIQNESNIGLTKSLNRGLQKCRGKWIARQDSDDFSYPNRLEEQLKFVEKNPKTVLLGTRWDEIRDGQTTEKNPMGLTDLELRWAMLMQNPFMHSSAIFPRMIKNHLVQYDEKFSFAQDYALWSELSLQGEIYILPHNLLQMTRHEKSISVERKRDQSALAVQVIEKELRALKMDWPLDSFVLQQLRLWWLIWPEKISKNDDDVFNVFLQIFKCFKKKHCKHPEWKSFEFKMKKRIPSFSERLKKKIKQKIARFSRKK